MRVEDNPGEPAAVTMLPALLRVLDPAGATVTIAATGCQAAIASQLGAQGADSVPARTKDHHTRHTDVAGAFAAGRAEAFVDTPADTDDHVRSVTTDHGHLAAGRAAAADGPPRRRAVRAPAPARAPARPARPRGPRRSAGVRCCVVSMPARSAACARQRCARSPAPRRRWRGTVRASDWCGRSTPRPASGAAPASGSGASWCRRPARPVARASGRGQRRRSRRRGGRRSGRAW